MNYMHAKLATDLVSVAHQSRYDVFLKKGPVVVDAKSILGVMSLYDTNGVIVVCEDHEIIRKMEELLNEL
jgi:phosphotransferase system HPr-like phosphotransfer protein